MFHDLIEYLKDNPLRTAVISFFAVLILLSAYDIGKGEWVAHNGTIIGKFTDTDCDDDGDCTTSYYVEVRHGGGFDNVQVNVWDYWKYSTNTPVRITYREGGVVHIRWFKSIEQMPANSY